MGNFPKNLPRNIGYKDYYLPEGITMASWNTLLDTLSIGEERYIELRGTPTAKVLNKLFPILNNPDKGVTLEFDLTNHPELYSKVDTLIDNYADIIKQSSRYLASTISLGEDNREVLQDSLTLPYNNPLVTQYVELVTYIKQKILSVLTIIDEYGKIGGVDRVDYVLDRFKSIEGLLSIVNSVNVTSGFLVSEGILTNFSQVDQWRKIFDSLYSSLIQYLRSEFAYNNLNKNFTNKYDEVKALLEDQIFVQSIDNNKKVTNFKLLIIRLYPTTGKIALGSPSPITTKLSNSRFIQTKSPKTNIRAALKNNIALNTPDTQWFDFYNRLFEDIIDYGNPECTLRFGTDKLKGCYIMEPFSFMKDNSSVLGFDINLMSRTTGSDLEEA